jgi:hypothetical protein
MFRGFSLGPSSSANKFRLCNFFISIPQKTLDKFEISYYNYISSRRYVGKGAYRS